MERTLDGDDLRYLLFRVGTIAGLALGVWRTMLVTNEARRQSEYPDKASSSSWNHKHQFGFVFSYLVIGIIFTLSTGALLNRFIPTSQTKVKQALVSRMPGHGGKGASFWLELQMPDRHQTQRVRVSTSEYRTFRVLDIVEIHCRRGMLGYDFVTDIVKVGSNRITN